MKIALIGYGKMGRMVETLALQRGHTIVAKITHEKLTPHILKDAEVCIDFSHPDGVLDHVKSIAQSRKNLVMGTTGWIHHENDVRKIVQQSNIGFIHSPNFSLGVALFFQIVEAAAKLIDPFPIYDVGLFEAHHNKKVDAPSGTAKTLATILSKTMTDRSSTNNPQIASVRCGSIPGTHSVIYDSPADTITLTHTARNREGFAAGAVSAAEWLQDKKGFYTLEDMLRSTK